MDKKSIRTAIKKQRESLTISQVNSMSKSVINNALSLDIFDKFSTFFVYKDFKNEVQTSELIKFLKSINKCVCYPHIKGDKMLAVAPTSDAFEKDEYGILTPTEYKVIESVDVAFIPLIACDKNKNRIGFGKGYYDKFLDGKSVYKIGLCYDFQVIDEISADPYDVCLNAIVTQTKIIK